MSTSREIKKLLTLTFKNIKFSVTTKKDRTEKIAIAWTGSPSENEVWEVVSPFQNLIHNEYLRAGTEIILKKQQEEKQQQEVTGYLPKVILQQIFKRGSVKSNPPKKITNPDGKKAIEQLRSLNFIRFCYKEQAWKLTQKGKQYASAMTLL